MAADARAPPAEALHEADGGRGLALSEGRGGDGGHIHIFAVRLIAEAFEHGAVIHLSHDVTVGKQLLVEEAEIAPELIDRLHTGFSILSDLPVRVLFRIKRHACLLVFL